MRQLDTLRLLVVAGPEAPVDRALAGLRERGHNLDQCLTAQADLRQPLSAGPWDLILCFGPAGQVQDLRTRLNEANLDIPLIAVLPDGTTDDVPLTQLEADDVLSFVSLERLPLSVEREVTLRRLERQTRQLETSLRALEQHHHWLLETAADAFCYAADGIHLYCNPAYAGFFGYPDAASITTVPLLDLVAQADRPPLRQALAAPQGERQLSLRGRSRDGALFPITLRCIPQEYRGRDALLLCVRTADGNATYAGRLAEIDARDLLTRLHNRPRFLQALEHAIGAALRDQRISALVLVQLEGLEAVEAALGRARTNRILADIGIFLRKTVQTSFTAARLDTHEFGLLLHESDPQEAVALAEFMRDRINQRAAGRAARLSATTGVALINDHAQDPADSLARARANLRAGAEYLEPGARQPGGDDLVRLLETGFDEGCLSLLFQPILSLRGASRPDYEVLLRLVDKTGEPLPPSTVTSIADLHGLGEQLDRRLLEYLLRRMDGEGVGIGRLLIKVTRNTLVSRTFLPWLGEALQAWRHGAELLRFQVSELDLCRCPERVTAFCRGLDELGLGRVYTHFGGARDPFRLLAGVGADYVVLDESLLRGIGQDETRNQRLRALVDALHKKHYPVAAPRVEDVALLPVLWQAGVDLAQGYSLQGPSPDMDCESVLEQEITLAAPQPQQ